MRDGSVVGDLGVLADAPRVEQLTRLPRRYCDFTVDKTVLSYILCRVTG
jgi:hypothetical protein